MATPTRILQEISANGRQRHEHSPYIRGQVIALRKVGFSFARISEETNLPISTCKSIHQRLNISPEGLNQHRTGRPKSLNQRDQRHIIRVVRRDPAITYQLLREKTGVIVSNRTISRLLDVYNIKNWRAKKRPKLTEKDARIRLAWALDHVDWELED